MNVAGFQEAWMQREHADQFGRWGRESTAKLVRTCDQFNEFYLFRTLVGNGDCQTLLDVGCATGNFYRYFHKLWPYLEYRGIDISEVAVEYAKSQNPAADFRVFNGDLQSVQGLASDIVFCRDVVHHQENPKAFLFDLYSITKKYLILRVRTRDVGATVFDPDQSCQYNYGHWVPYIVINVSELIDLLRSFQPAPGTIVLRKHPVVLGGQDSRFLPKELYYPETGTAETALLIEKRVQKGDGNTIVSMETHPESRNRGTVYWVRWLRWLVRRCGL